MGFDVGFDLSDFTDEDLSNLLTIMEGIDVQPDPDEAPLFRRIIDRSRSVRKIKEEMSRRKISEQKERMK